MGFERSTPGRHLPLTTKIKIFFISTVLDSVRRPNGTINRRLVSLMEATRGPNATPVRGVRTADFTLGPARRLWFRLFIPAAPAAASLPVVVFFHGGGFSFLSAATLEYDALCRRFCRKLGVAVVSVNYRLSPEHRFPAQYDDGVDVLRFLESKKAADFSGKNSLLEEFFRAADLSCCFLAGDSAGANIAHHVARRWTADENHHVRLCGIISIQPFFGGETRMASEIRLQKAPLFSFERVDWMWKAYLPAGATRDHPAANPEAAAEDLSESFPPVMVIVGEFDPLQDWQRKYFESLRKTGREAKIIEYPGAIHAFYTFPELKYSLIEDMGSFIFEHGGQGEAVGAVAM